MWRVGNGRRIRLGEDLWEGKGEEYKLSKPVLIQLRAQRIHMLVDVQAQQLQQKGRAGWKSTQDMSLEGEDAEEWNRYVNELVASFL